MLGLEVVRIQGTAGAAGVKPTTPFHGRVSVRVLLGVGIPLALGAAWLATAVYPAATVTAQSAVPGISRGLAEGSAGGPPAAWMTQSLAPAPVNVQLAKQRVAEMFPGIEAKLATPDAPSVTQEPGTARYTWALDAKHGRIATADVQSAYVVLDPGGRLIGFGLE